MKIQDLEKLATEGKLRITIYHRGTGRRRKFIWSNEPDILDQKIISTKEIIFNRFIYEARTPEMDKYQCLRIRKNDFVRLRGAGAIVHDLPDMKLPV